MSTRQAVHTFVAAFVMTAVITGCSPAPEKAPQAPPAGPAPSPAPSPTPGAPDGGVQPGLRWDLISSGEGAALLLTDAEGDAVMQWACMRSPARLIVRVARFRAIASEERLSIGTHDEAFALVADLGEPGPGVKAQGDIPAELLTRLPAAESVSASYGAQKLGPLMPPEKAQAEHWATACREMAAG